MFGDRLHIRVRSGQSEQAVERLQASLTAGGGQVDRLRQIPPQLEDVFMSLLEASQ